jgi:peptidylprolyl isomerase
MADSQERTVQNGDKVRVDYVGRYPDGTVFDSSEGNEPLQFKVGAGEVIPGFDQAVMGLKAGESRTVEVTPEDAYGPHVPEMVAEVERSQIPDDDKLQFGGFLEVGLEDGQTLDVQVVELTETTVTLDGNHPLAGKSLHFEVTLLEFT